MPDETQPTNAQIMVEIKAVSRDTKDMKARLFGNGRPGLILTVDRIEKYVNTRVWVERLLISVTAAILLGGAFTGVIYLIKNSQG